MGIAANPHRSDVGNAKMPFENFRECQMSWHIRIEKLSQFGVLSKETALMMKVESFRAERESIGEKSVLLL
jgi:hypothetical protein